MRRDNGFSRRLKGGNKKSTAETLQLRWEVLTPVRDM